MPFSIKVVQVKFLLTLAFIILGIENYAQSNTHEFRVKNLLNYKIKKSDFREGQVFLTLDTIDCNDLFAESNFIQTNNPDTVINCFIGFMKSIKLEGSYYHYSELINSPFFESPLIINFFVNTESHSYNIRIWTDKGHTDKIEGITVAKHITKFARQ
ncbi:MAG: hypothetical protein FGM46_06955 [Ferruginibacter sp.]|nr:hypothetical protein [Ferruginibacter sp.]